MERLRLSLALAIGLSVGVTGIALAASATITPASQTHNHGVASHWTLSWGGGSPYEVLFQRGNGTGVYWPSTNAVTSSQSYTFRPCLTETFGQALEVWTGIGTYANDTSWAKEFGGNPC